MHRGDSGGDGINALVVRSDPSYSISYVGVVSKIVYKRIAYVSAIVYQIRLSLIE